jgi:hypothetical protein
MYERPAILNATSSDEAVALQLTQIGNHANCW